MMMDIGFGRILILVSYINMFAIGHAFTLPDSVKQKGTCDFILVSMSALDVGNEIQIQNSAMS